jgi:hypothetical protein
MRRTWCTVVAEVAALVVSAGSAGAQEATVEHLDPAALVSLVDNDGGTCTGVPRHHPRHLRLHRRLRRPRRRLRVRRGPGHL